MACHAPQVERPGEYFDLLLGPWMEQVQEGYHRLSPLLYGSADEIFTPEEIKALHKSAARSYLAEKKITATELKGAFFHGFIGEALDVLDGLYSFTLRAESEIWPHICHALEWLIYLGVGQNTRLFPADQVLSVQLRHVQFRVARETAEISLATQIAGLWEWEIEQLDSAEIPTGFKSANYFLLFGHVLYDIRFPLRPSVMVSMSMRQLSLIQEAKDEAFIKEIISRHAETFDDTRFTVMNAASRYHAPAEIEEFFVSLHAQEPRTADRIWAQLKNDDYFAALLLDGLWLNEVDAESPNWRSSIESVERILNIGLAHSADSLIAEAYRIKAIIYEEYLHDSQKALQSLDEGQAQLGAQHPILNEYRAKIFSLENREGDALDLWDKIFPSLEQSENPNRIFSYRDAMIAAARLGKWEKAAEYAVRAESATHKSQYDKSLALGFRADQGLALWLSR